MNAVLCDKWKELPYECNAFALKKKLKSLPKIIHFTSNQKPWKHRCDNPYKKYYWAHLSKTPFHDIPSITSIAVCRFLSLIMPSLSWIKNISGRKSA